MFIYICIYTVIIFEMLCQCRLYLGIHIHKQTALPLLISIRFWFSIHLWTTSNLKKSVYIYIYVRYRFFEIFSPCNQTYAVYIDCSAVMFHTASTCGNLWHVQYCISIQRPLKMQLSILCFWYIYAVCCDIYIYMYKYVVVKAWAIAKASKIVDPWEPVAGPIPSTTGDKAPWSWNLRSYFPEGVLCTSQRNHLLLNSKIHDACWAVEKLLNGTEKNLQCWNMLGKRHS